MKTGFEVFQPLLDKNREAINAGQPVSLEVKEYATFTRKLVRARVSQSKEALKAPQDLWVMGSTEVLYPAPWAIEILEELDDDKVQLEYPQSEGSIGLYNFSPAQKKEEK